MPYDAIAVSAVRAQLESALTGGKIEKIYQPEKDEVWLSIRNGREQIKLLISADSGNPRIHLTGGAKQNPLAAPMFCMLLRKYIGGGKIAAVSQPAFERIIDIQIECYDEMGDLKTRRLISEIMGRHSNIILADGDKIVDSIKRVDLTVSSVRNILPGLTYALPPSQDKLRPQEADSEEVYQRLLSLEENIPIEKAVVKGFYGFSPLAGREISYRATGQSDGRLEPNNIKAVARCLSEFIDAVNRKSFTPVLLYNNDGKAMDFAAYNVSFYENLARVVTFDTISCAMDEYFSARDKWERMRQKSAAIRKNVTNALERCKKKLALQRETLREAEDRERWRISGELITANLYRLNAGSEIARVENFYAEGNPVTDIPLDKLKTPAQNAAAYFTKYRKAKTAAEVVCVQMDKNIREIEYLTSVLASIDIAEGEDDLAQIRQELLAGGYIKADSKAKKGRQKEPAAQPLRFEIDGYEILVGRNNRQNDIVTMKLGRSSDMWLHVKNMPGSHVVIKNQGTDIPKGVIEKAASLAVYYSSAREAEMAQVDYTACKNVKKPAGALPGKVIYDNYKTAYVAPHNYLS